MTGNDYNIALFIFFIPYILFEVPSNIMIKRVAPSTWLAGRPDVLLGRHYHRSRACAHQWRTASHALLARPF